MQNTWSSTSMLYVSLITRQPHTEYMAFYLHAVNLPHYTSITRRIHGLVPPRCTSPSLHVNHTHNTWPSTSTLYISLITRQPHTEYMAFYLHAVHLRITRQPHTEYMAFYLHAVHLLHYTSIKRRIHGLLAPRCTSPALHVNLTHNTWSSTSTLYISRIRGQSHADTCSTTSMLSISYITRQSHAEYMAFYLHAVHLPHYTSITPTIHGLLPPCSTSAISHVLLHAEYMAFYLHGLHLLHYTSITRRIHGLLPPRCPSPT